MTLRPWVVENRAREVAARQRPAPECGCIRGVRTGHDTEGAFVNGECSAGVHVNCDDGCLAYTRPQDYAEALRTLIHYRDHGWLYGCSHGC